MLGLKINHVSKMCPITLAHVMFFFARHILLYGINADIYCSLVTGKMTKAPRLKND